MALKLVYQTAVDWSVNEDCKQPKEPISDSVTFKAGIAQYRLGKVVSAWRITSIRHMLHERICMFLCADMCRIYFNYYIIFIWTSNKGEIDKTMYNVNYMSKHNLT
jgi:hypothetical protein